MEPIAAEINNTIVANPAMDEERFLPFALPDIGQEEIDEVVDSLRSGWITTGPKTKRFEEAFAAYLGVEHALAVNSATAGLHLALEAIGLERGDKVITTPYTFTATAEVIRYFDADPIFSDVDPLTFNLDPDALCVTVQQAVAAHGAKVKAIVVVHMAGQACDMDPILALAHQHGLRVIEDAAHALPTTYKGRKIGTLSDITVFSFYATKTLATAEGGMVVTSNPEIAKRIKTMRLHGFNRDAWDRYTSHKAAWFYEIVAPGFKYNLTDLASAMGIHQLAKCDAFYQRRRWIASCYDEALQGLAGLRIPHVERPEDQHAFHLYMLSVLPEWRDRFFEAMRTEGIGCSVHFIPLHLHPYWRQKYDMSPSDFPHATRAYERELSLPIYTRMTNRDVHRVIEAVQKVHRLLEGSC